MISTNNSDCNVIDTKPCPKEKSKKSKKSISKIAVALVIFCAVAFIIYLVLPREEVFPIGTEWKLIPWLIKKRYLPANATLPNFDSSETDLKIKYAAKLILDDQKDNRDLAAMPTHIIITDDTLSRVKHITSILNDAFNSDPFGNGKLRFTGSADVSAPDILSLPAELELSIRKIVLKAKLELYLEATVSVSTLLSKFKSKGEGNYQDTINFQDKLGRHRLFVEKNNTVTVKEFKQYYSFQCILNLKNDMDMPNEIRICRTHSTVHIFRDTDILSTRELYQVAFKRSI